MPLLNVSHGDAHFSMCIWILCAEVGMGIVLRNNLGLALGATNACEAWKPTTASAAVQHQAEWVHTARNTSRCLKKGLASLVKPRQTPSMFYRTPPHCAWDTPGSVFMRASHNLENSLHSLYLSTTSSFYVCCTQRKHRNKLGMYILKFSILHAAIVKINLGDEM